MPRMISYAQNFEDVMLWRALSHVRNGCYVDVGAQSPDTDSVSRLFYENGWRGVHVEPTPQYANLLRDRRPDEVVLQVAVSDQPGILQFFIIADTGLSTTDAAMAATYRGQGFQVSDVRVPAVPLDTVLDQITDSEVHWLKIDVEGAEALVIEGWKRGGPRPWVLVIESTRPISTEQVHSAWEPAVLEHGYEFVYFDGLNRFYISDEHLELRDAFASGPNVFDDFWLSSSSQFCGLVNTQYSQLQIDADAQRVALEAQLVEAQQRCIDLEAELRAGAADMERQRNDHARAMNAMVDSQHRILAEHRAVLATAAEESQREVSELATQITAGRHEAHRWWLAHEHLLAELDAMKHSRSWQLTRPFRAVRNRLSASALGRLKRALRPATLGLLRLAVASPGLRRIAKPVVARIPFLYNRLYALAVQEQLFEMERQRLAVLEGKERDHDVVYLDKRAARVLADLKQTRNAKATQ